MKRKILIEDVVGPSIRKPIPCPPEEMGKNLDTLEKAVWWLSHPSNWQSSRIVLIRWDGVIPKISEYHGRRLVDFPDDVDMASSVILEQRRRKLLGTRKDDEEQNET